VIGEPVAISNGRDRHQDPPNGVPESGNAGGGCVTFGLKPNSDARDDDRQREMSTVDAKTLSATPR
jgi:hypothetical protein